jgi:hypothetical protein
MTWWPKSRYVLLLEQDNERLRERECLLLDALMMREGLPTLTPRVPKPPQRSTGKMMPSQFVRKMTNWVKPKADEKPA